MLEFNVTYVDGGKSISSVAIRTKFGAKGIPCQLNTIPDRACFGKVVLRSGDTVTDMTYNAGALLLSKQHPEGTYVRIEDVLEFEDVHDVDRFYQLVETLKEVDDKQLRVLTRNKNTLDALTDLYLAQMIFPEHAVARQWAERYADKRGWTI